MRRLFLFMVWMLMFHQSVTGQDTDSWLTRGLEAEEAGEVEQALQIWTDARAQLETPSLDIAIEYIRLVTEQQMKAYYPMASSIYMWGLSDTLMTDTNTKAFHEELSRLEPLVDDGQYDRWLELLDSRNPLLLDELRGYWQTMNPVPGRSYNVRLLEHWERIAYARDHFTRGDEEPYGTDERGRYYVMYGEPDHQEDGILPLSQHDITRILSGVENTGPIYGRGSMFSSDDLTRIIFNVLYQQAGAPHQYEYWVYYSPAEEMAFNMILIFGDKGAGEYGRIFTVDDFIPNTLLGSSLGRIATLVALEIYYDHLAVEDAYFANRYQELVRRKETAPNFENAAATVQAMKRQNYVMTYREMEAAPDQISTEENSVPQIPVDIYQYRLLNEEGDPVLLSFVESRPTTAFALDLDEGQQSFMGSTLDRYRLTHGVHLRDPNQRVISRSTYRPELFIDSFDDTPSSSVFTVPFISTETTQLFYAELENTDPESERRFESLIPDEIRGVGKIELLQPDPLPSDGHLLLGDLIMGYQRQAESVEGTRFPFFVSNSRQIPQGENLVVHFELYNLGLDDSGIADFEVEYDIQSVRRILFWDRMVSEDDLSITLGFQHDAPRFTESLEIETQGLELGNYELVWSARDLTSGDETVQNIQFEISSSE